MADPMWWRQKYPQEQWKVFEDFRYFLWMVWRHLMLPDPTSVQYDIATFLQSGPRRSVIEAFRGVGKSWITSAFVCWLLLRNPDDKIMVVSASKDRADQFSTFTKRLIAELPLLEHLIPDRGKGDRDSNIAFDVRPAMADHSPSVKSVGIMGQLTGSRANLIIADDVEVPNNSETQGMRDKLAERVKEFDAILKPGGRIIYLGTPQCEDSLYNQLPERGYEVRIWPARYPKDGLKTYGDRLAPKLVMALEQDPSLMGLSTDPKRFDDVDLMEREASYGRSGFALQFMLDTRLSDADKYPLKLSDLIVMGVNREMAPQKIIWSAAPEYMIKDTECVGLNGDRYYSPAFMAGDWVPYTGSVLAIDPSGRGKDETSYAVVKMLNGYLHVTTAGGIQGGYDEATLMKLAQIAKDQAVNLVLIESNFGDGMFAALLRPFLRKVYPVTIEEVRSNTQKERRIIDTLEPVMNQHRLVIDKRVIQQDYESTKRYPPEQAVKRQLFYQMSRITRDKGALAFDDRLDALAMAVAYWVEQMGQDENQKIADRRDELLEMELAVFHGTARSSLDALALGMSPEQFGRGGEGVWYDND